MDRSRESDPLDPHAGVSPILPNLGFHDFSMTFPRESIDIAPSPRGNVQSAEAICALGRSLEPIASMKSMEVSDGGERVEMVCAEGRSRICGGKQSVDFRKQEKASIFDDLEDLEEDLLEEPFL